MFSEENHEYTTHLSYESLGAQFGHLGKAVKAIHTMARETAQALRYRVVDVIWVDIVVSEGKAKAALRVELGAAPGDTLDAFDDRMQLLSQEIISKSLKVQETLERSCELAALGQPHEISSDPSRQRDETVIFQLDPIAAKAARTLAQLGLQEPFVYSIDGGSEITLQGPGNGGVMVVDSTSAITAVVEVVGLLKPHAGCVVYLKEVAGKRRRYTVSFDVERYDFLLNAMSILSDQRFEVTLQPIISMSERSTRQGRYRLVTIKPEKNDRLLG